MITEHLQMPMIEDLLWMITEHLLVSEDKRIVSVKMGTSSTATLQFKLHKLVDRGFWLTLEE